MSDYPRWLYSKDHGSIVVDTPEDAVNLPAVDWWTTSTFEGEPYIRAEPAASMLTPTEIANLALEKLVVDKRKAEVALVESTPYDQNPVVVQVSPTMTSDQALDAMVANAEELGLYEQLPEGTVVTIDGLPGERVITETVVVDKRTKAYKDSQKAPL